MREVLLMMTEKNKLIERWIPKHNNALRYARLLLKSKEHSIICETARLGIAALSLVDEIQSLINIGVDPTVAATTVNNERTRRAVEGRCRCGLFPYEHPEPQQLPGISAEMKEEFKEIVREAITAIAALVNPIPPTQPTSVIPTPGHDGVMNAHIPELPPADIDPWETYVVTRNPLEKDYYYNKLFPRFKAVNGDNRFRLSKHTAFIVIKDGSERIFKCDRNNASFQRNLYLEFHDCDYNCEVWKEEYLNKHSMDYKETDSPPLHFLV